MVDRGGAVIQFNCFHRRQVGDQEHAVARPDRTRGACRRRRRRGMRQEVRAQQITHLAAAARLPDGGGAMRGMGIDAQSMGRQWSPGPL
uniref:Uncharacterized protein n=1 Tax=Oryza barthii TaxID=65489 RepID=A0A0D3HP76_9ORYZ